MNKKNFSLYGLPEKIEFCEKCVISNQRPSSVVEFKNQDDQKQGIEFDSNDLVLGRFELPPLTVTGNTSSPTGASFLTKARRHSRR